MLTTFDIIVGIFVLISALLATSRGATREILSLASWAGAAFFAWWMFANHSDLAKQYIADATVADIVTIAASFTIALIILHLITMRIADFVVDSRIGALDRTLGFLFGAARGILIAVVVVIFGQWLAREQLDQFAGESQTLPRLEQLADDLIAALPDNIEEEVNRYLNRGGVTAEEQAITADPSPDSGGTDQFENGEPQTSNT